MDDRRFPEGAQLAHQRLPVGVVGAASSRRCGAWAERSRWSDWARKGRSGSRSARGCSCSGGSAEGSRRRRCRWGCPKSSNHRRCSRRRSGTGSDSPRGCRSPSSSRAAGGCSSGRVPDAAGSAAGIADERRQRASAIDGCRAGACSPLAIAAGAGDEERRKRQERHDEDGSIPLSRLISLQF